MGRVGTAAFAWATWASMEIWEEEKKTWKADPCQAWAEGASLLDSASSEPEKSSA